MSDLTQAGRLMARVERIMRAAALTAGPVVEAPASMTAAARLDLEWALIADPVFRDARLADLDEVTRAKAEEWLAGPSQNMILMGPVGVGKSHAAMAIARECLARGQWVECWPIARLWRDLRPGGEEGLERWIVDAGVLVLDDLGSDRPTDWTTEQLFLIVDERWRRRRPIISTTNLSVVQLKETLDPRVYDRLAGRAMALQLAGGSRRRA